MQAICEPLIVVNGAAIEILACHTVMRYTLRRLEQIEADSPELCFAFHDIKRMLTTALCLDDEADEGEDLFGEE